MSSRYFPFDRIMIGPAVFDQNGIVPRSMSFHIRGKDISVDCVGSGHHIFRTGAEYSVCVQLFGRQLDLCRTLPQEICLWQNGKELIRFRGIADALCDDGKNCTTVSITGTDLLKDQECPA